MSVMGDSMRNAMVGFMSVIIFCVFIVLFGLLLYWLAQHIEWGKIGDRILNKLFGG